MTINDTQNQDEYFSSMQVTYPAKYYLTLKSSDFNRWRERWECMLWEKKDEYSHLPFEDFPESESADRGKFFKLNEDDIYNPLKTSEKDIDDASIWVIPGALSTSRYGMSITLKDIKSFLSDNGCNYWNGKSIIFCPYSSGKQRYIEAMEYNNDPQKYYSTQIEKFVRKYLIPRIIKEKQLSFITYSVGGKELAMIENAARNILINEYGYPINIVEKLFQAVTAICIGYASDIKNLPELRFNKVVLLSASDQGLFIPKSLYLKIYRPIICNRPFTAFKIDQYETLIFLGHQSSVELLDGKLNHDGHRFPHYLKAMTNNIPQTIFKYLHSLIFNNNDRERALDYELAQLLVEI